MGSTIEITPRQVADALKKGPRYEALDELLQPICDEGSLRGVRQACLGVLSELDSRDALDRRDAMDRPFLTVPAKKKAEPKAKAGSKAKGRKK